MRSRGALHAHRGSSQLVKLVGGERRITFAMDITRENGLLAWQWSIYPAGHRDRSNLAVHALTVPLFVLGTCALPVSPLLGSWWLAACGLGAMVGAIALQERTHKREKIPPAPIRGPLDVVARLFAEQWVTFPRYVLSGKFSRAWRTTSG
jgi:hypothetical protein